MTVLSETFQGVQNQLKGHAQNEKTGSEARGTFTPKGSVIAALRQAEVPERYLNARLQDFGDGRLQELQWDRCGYFLSGNPGIGKTHLAAAMLRSRLDPTHPKTVAEKREHRDANGVFEVWEFPRGRIGWITAPRFLTMIRSTYGRKDSEVTERKIVETYSNLTVLVIDDLGAEKITDWSASTLYDLISWREANLLDTIVTTNQDIDDIRRWEPRIASRLEGFGRYTLPDIDRRAAG